MPTIRALNPKHEPWTLLLMTKTNKIKSLCDSRSSGNSAKAAEYRRLTRNTSSNSEEEI
ncbi:hypothetical protein GGF41_004796 [Coemansia sp. RSA 2531]|nr:hypothetical protein GGF41_004796 [Coemansia sp. RSA 2531]